jgi:hypothetical protein
MPAAVVRCDNPTCPHVGQDRTVEYPAAGDGLYHRLAIVCVCGHIPQTILRWVDKGSTPVRTADAAPAQTRARRPRKAAR